VRLFVGTGISYVDHVAAATPMHASFWVVDARGGALTSSPTALTAPTTASHVGAAPVYTPSNLALGLSALTGLALAKSLGASWGLAVGAAIGAPIVILGIALLASYTRAQSVAAQAALNGGPPPTL
jgi:hypothetical protein